MDRFRILLVDDGRHNRDFMRIKLEGAGYEVTTASGPCLDQLPSRLSGGRSRPHLIILGLAYPTGSGADLLKQVKGLATCPVIVVSRNTADADRVNLLRAGADDCLSDPCNLDELVARVEAIRRRLKPEAEALPENLSWGDVVVETGSHRVTINGKSRYLSRLEWLLLMELIRNAGRPVPHEVLLSRVWGRGYRSDKTVLRMCISQLRGKLDSRCSNRKLISTVRSRGYVMDEPHNLSQEYQCS